MERGPYGVFQAVFNNGGSFRSRDIVELTGQTPVAVGHTLKKMQCVKLDGHSYQVIFNPLERPAREIIEEIIRVCYPCPFAHSGSSLCSRIMEFDKQNQGRVV